MLALMLGLLVAADIGAQPSQPDARPPAPATPAKQAAKKPAARKETRAPAYKMVLEPRAMDLLKAVSARLAAARSMTFTATVGYEYPSKLGPPIVYTSRYDVTVQRPDRLKVVMPGDGPASEFYYDGKQMMAYAPAANLVAVADAPPSIDAMLQMAYDHAAIYYPFTDLIVADPYAALADGARLAFYIGRSKIVGGVDTDMLAWANDDVFIQIWIGADDNLPYRIRAIYSADPLQLRHEMDLSNWRLDPPMASDAFTSQKAASAQRMAFTNPAAAPPPGVKPLPLTKRSKAAAPAPPSKPQ